jgi:hypothetical protein
MEVQWKSSRKTKSASGNQKQKDLKGGQGRITERTTIWTWDLMADNERDDEDGAADAFTV